MNSSADINSKDLAKYFECMRRRDPILNEIKLSKDKYINSLEPDYSFNNYAPNAGGVGVNNTDYIKELRQIHARTFSDHNTDWKHKYTRPF